MYSPVDGLEVDKNILQIISDLHKEVMYQKEMITSLQARILVLEDGKDQQKTHKLGVQTEGKAKATSEEGNIANQLFQNNEEVLLKLPGGRIRPSRFVSNAEGPVAFQAHLTSDITHITLNQKIIFDFVSLNLGNGYHAAHGLFIAPRPGIFIFSASLLAHSSKNVQMVFMKNGSSLGGGILATSDGVIGFDQGSATVVAQLNAGDEVWIENGWPDDTSLRATQNTCFMGCLVMEL